MGWPRRRWTTRPPSPSAIPPGHAPIRQPPMHATVWLPPLGHRRRRRRDLTRVVGDRGVPSRSRWSPLPPAGGQECRPRQGPRIPSSAAPDAPAVQPTPAPAAIADPSAAATSQPAAVPKAVEPASTAPAAAAPRAIRPGERGDPTDVDALAPSVWQAVARRDYPTALRLLRAQPDQAGPLVGDLAATARATSDAARRLAEARGGTVRESDGYRTGAAALARAEKLDAAGATIDGLAARWEASEAFARAVPAPIASPEQPMTGAAPVPAPPGPSRAPEPTPPPPARDVTGPSRHQTRRCPLHRRRRRRRRPARQLGASLPAASAGSAGRCARARGGRHGGGWRSRDPGRIRGRLRRPRRRGAARGLQRSVGGSGASADPNVRRRGELPARSARRRRRRRSIERHRHLRGHACAGAEGRQSVAHDADRDFHLCPRCDGWVITRIATGR